LNQNPKNEKNQYMTFEKLFVSAHINNTEIIILIITTDNFIVVLPIA